MSKIINDYINDDIIIDILKYAVVGSIVSIILTLCRACKKKSVNSANLSFL